MWFPSFFQTISSTQRGRVLFVLVIAIFVGVVIGVSQGPSPKASTFDVRPADAGMTIAAPARTSIVGEAIPLPTQPPADNTQVIAAAAMATQTDTILTTEAITRDIDGKVVVRADAFAPEDQPQPELRMASAFAGIPAFDSFAPAPEQWPGFSSLGGGGGTTVGGAESPLFVGDKETPAATPPDEEAVAAVQPAPETERPDVPNTAVPAVAQPVPEPSSFLLMMLALMGLAFAARRRNLICHPRA